jgi:hypothetical protein
MGFLIACMVVIMFATIFGIIIYQVISKNPEYAKVKVSTLEDEVRTIRLLKELEYWKDIKNGK